MKIVFLSNYINHHQVGLSNELYKMCGPSNYYFIQEESLPEEKINLGYINEFENNQYVIKLNKENQNQVLKIINDADIIINCFSQGLNLLKDAMKSKKNIIWYSERLYKDYNLIKSFLKYLRAKYYFDFYKNHNQYQIFASYYGFKDVSKTTHLFKNKCFQFGYFPISNSKMVIERKKCKEKVNILFLGRLLKWKHPELCFKIADLLREKKIDFFINIVGDGPLYKKMNKIINAKYNDCIKLVGSIDALETSNMYLENDIFVFSSDRREGWGATLMEAMSYGCICIANYEAGSTKVLIKNGVNGYIYNKKNFKEILFEAVEKIIDNRHVEMSKNASELIVDEWNYVNAAARLYQVCDRICNNLNLDYYKDGIMKKYK